MAGMLKGALISFAPTFLGLTTPNVIVFQTNPESIVHTWTAAASNQQDSGGGAPGAAAKTNVSPLSVSGPPGETFAFTIVLDANDDIADGATNPIAAGIATLTGVYTRLAALELLQFPPLNNATIVGQVSSAAGAAAAGASATPVTNVVENDVPIALFVWGPQRIVPVRLTALTTTEKLYDVLLNPSYAEAQITLRVLTPDELKAVTGPMQQIANTAYTYMQTLRQAQAIANLGDSVASILGMLPTPF